MALFSYLNLLRSPIAATWSAHGRQKRGSHQHADASIMAGRFGAASQRRQPQARAHPIHIRRFSTYEGASAAEIFEGPNGRRPKTRLENEADRRIG